MITSESLVGCLLAILLLVSPFIGLGSLGGAQTTIITLIAAVVLILIIYKWKVHVRLLPWPILAIVLLAVLSMTQAIDMRAALRELLQIVLWAVLFVAAFGLVSSVNGSLLWIIGPAAALNVILGFIGSYDLFRGATPGSSVLMDRHVFMVLLTSTGVLSVAWLTAFRCWIYSISAVMVAIMTAVCVPASGWLALSVGGIFLLSNSANRIGGMLLLGFGWLSIACTAAIAPAYFHSQLGNIVLAEGPPIDMQGRRQTSQYLMRYVEWKANFRMLQDHMALGIGPGNYRLMKARYFDGPSRENSLLEERGENGWLIIATTMGIYQMVAVAWLYCGAIGCGVSRFLVRFQQAPTFAACSAAVVVLMVSNVFTDVWLRQLGPLSMALLGGCWGSCAIFRAQESQCGGRGEQSLT